MKKLKPEYRQAPNRNGAVYRSLSPRGKHYVEKSQEYYNHYLQKCDEGDERRANRYFKLMKLCKEKAKEEK